MYAIVEIAGKQFRVEKEQTVKVPHLNAESGSKLTFDRVLFYSDDAGKSQIGQPVIKDMQVTATVVEHGREKKIVVFKKKRRKGYRVKKGHRQEFSKIKIEDIKVVKAAKKAKEEPKAEPKAEAKKEVKKATAKKAPAKKAAAKPKSETKAKSAAKDKPAEGKEA